MTTAHPQLADTHGTSRSVPALPAMDRLRPLDAGALMAALVTALLVVVSFSYVVFVYPARLTAYLTPMNIALLYGAGVLFGSGIVAAVANRRTALAVSMFYCYVFYFLAVREQIYGSFDTILANQGIVAISLTADLLFGVILIGVNAIPLDCRPAPQEAELAARPAGRLAWVILGCCLLQTAFIAFCGPILLSSRVELGEFMTAQMGRPIATLVFNFLFSLMFLVPVIVLLSHRPAKLDLVRSLGMLSLALGCLLNNPMVHPRFYVGVLAVGTILLLINPVRTGPTLLVVSAATLVAPVLNLFRDLWSWEHVDVKLGLAALRSFDFDAFASTCYGVLYSQEHGFLYGTNILGSLLFFVPSSVWPGKPENTGGLLYDAVIQRNRLVGPDNLSAPLTVEGYLAFGWLGVVLLALAFALVVRWLDGAPQPHGLRGRALLVRTLCLAYAPTLLIFLQRGSLMPTFAYTSGMYFAVLVAARLARAPTQPRAGQQLGAAGSAFPGIGPGWHHRLP